MLKTKIHKALALKDKVCSPSISGTVPDIFQVLSPTLEDAQTKVAKIALCTLGEDYAALDLTL